jgi:hypothetical protein
VSENNGHLSTGNNHMGSSSAESSPMAIDDVRGGDQPIDLPPSLPDLNDQAVRTADGMDDDDESSSSGGGNSSTAESWAPAMLETMVTLFPSCSANEQSAEGTGTAYVMKVDADSFVIKARRLHDLSTSLCHAKSVCCLQTQNVRTHNNSRSRIAVMAAPGHPFRFRTSGKRVVNPALHRFQNLEICRVTVCSEDATAVTFHIHMCIIDDCLNKTNYFTDTQLAVVNVALNFVRLNPFHEYFGHLFQDIEIDVRDSYRSMLLMMHRFESSSRDNIISKCAKGMVSELRGVYGLLFLKSIELFMDILANPQLSERAEYDVLKCSCDEYSLTGFTSDDFAYSFPGSPIPFELIHNAACTMIPNCVYMAQAVGIKEAWLHSPCVSGELDDNDRLLQQIDTGMRYIHSGIEKMVEPGTFASRALTIFVDFGIRLYPKDQSKALLLLGVPAARFAEQAIAAERIPGKHFVSVESERGKKTKNKPGAHLTLSVLFPFTEPVPPGWTDLEFPVGVTPFWWQQSTRLAASSVREERSESSGSGSDSDYVFQESSLDEDLSEEYSDESSEEHSDESGSGSEGSGSEYEYENPSDDDASFDEDIGEVSEDIDGSLVGVSPTLLGNVFWHYGGRKFGNYHGGKIKMQRVMEEHGGSDIAPPAAARDCCIKNLQIYMPHLRVIEGKQNRKWEDLKELPAHIAVLLTPPLFEGMDTALRAKSALKVAEMITRLRDIAISSLDARESIHGNHIRIETFHEFHGGYVCPQFPRTQVAISDMVAVADRREASSYWTKSLGGMILPLDIAFRSGFTLAYISSLHQNIRTTLLYHAEALIQFLDLTRFPGRIMKCIKNEIPTDEPWQMPARYRLPIPSVELASTLSMTYEVDYRAFPIIYEPPCVSLVDTDRLDRRVPQCFPPLYVSLIKKSTNLPIQYLQNMANLRQILARYSALGQLRDEEREEYTEKTNLLRVGPMSDIDMEAFMDLDSDEVEQMLTEAVGCTILMHSEEWFVGLCRDKSPRSQKDYTHVSPQIRRGMPKSVLPYRNGMFPGWFPTNEAALNAFLTEEPHLAAVFRQATPRATGMQSGFVENHSKFPVNIDHTA